MEESKNRKWSFVTYGTSVDTRYNGYSGSVENGDLSLWCLNGKGKLVPASTDGLAFYYTVIDAAGENFTLSADIEVESWTYSNGQDGFGLMAADTIGVNGDEASLWNNSYMAAVTRVEYCYDPGTGSVSEVGEKYSMKLGIGAQEKKGVTVLSNKEGTQVQHFSSTMRTLETTAPKLGLEPGCYNLAGAYTNAEESMRNAARLTVFHLSLRRMNDGYLIGYTNEAGETAQWKYYRGKDGDELTGLDGEHIYAGFFAARNAKIKVRNVELQIIAPEQDEKPEVRPITLVTPRGGVESAAVANREDYELVYYGNADGSLVITQRNAEADGRDNTHDENAGKDCGENGCLIAKQTVRAFAKCRIPVKLRRGENFFQVSFTPDENYCPSGYERLASYETQNIPFRVSYQVREGKEIYISPGGRTDGTGTREKPLDIYTAVNSAVPGQKLILTEGRYLLEKPLVVARGMNGTPEEPICLTAEEGCRPVLDFGKKSKGLTLAADYWHYRGFDVTNTMRAERGVHLTGSHNVLERLSIHHNGNTGFQISRLLDSDLWEEWPGDNRVINCTSYLNADPGYTDSDGFAAKITVAEGNMFEGCISAYNADDGFDLFAKVERGATGSVLIKNCLAFKNGYILDEEGREVHVGLGNGFKLGGSSIACGHRLENSIAFANGEKGVDSNSCPDAKVSYVISFNNDSHNVALFTTDAFDTAFRAEGVLSFRTEGTVPDKLELRGSQEEKDIYGPSNYYFDGEKSANSEGKQACTSWFTDLDADRAVHGGIFREEDGSICLNGFLELTEEAPSDIRKHMAAAFSGM